MRLDVPRYGRRRHLTSRRLTNGVGLVEVFLAMYRQFDSVPALFEQLVVAAAGGTEGARLLVARYQGPENWSGLNKKNSKKSKFYLNFFWTLFRWTLTPSWRTSSWRSQVVRRRFKLGCPRLDPKNRKFIFDQNWWRIYFKNRDLGHPNSRIGWTPCGWSGSCPALSTHNFFLL